MSTSHQTSRRTVLATGAAGLAAAGVASGDAVAAGRRKPRVVDTKRPAPLTRVTFEHGVASGDPLPSAVVIWTRVTPGPAATPGSGVGVRVDGRWEVALDAGFTRILHQGPFTTTIGRDHTVKVDVTGDRKSVV